MRCKQCDRLVKHWRAESWKRWQICPGCWNTKHQSDSKNLDSPIMVIEFNPVDMYWSVVTAMYYSDKGMIIHDSRL